MAERVQLLRRSAGQKPEYSGPEVEIGFNAQYLLDFLKAVPEESVAFHFRDPQSAGEMRPSGGSENYNYRYVIMPMRI